MHIISNYFASACNYENLVSPNTLFICVGFMIFCQISLEDNLLPLPKGSVEQSSNLEMPYDLENMLFENSTADSSLTTSPYQLDSHLDQQTENSTEGNSNYAFTLRQQLLDGEEGLKKVDSFSRWVTKELGEVDNLQMQSSSGIPWSTVENVVDDSSLSPSISQDQLFSIIDFSPKWGFTDSQPKVFNMLYYSF